MYVLPRLFSELEREGMMGDAADDARDQMEWQEISLTLHEQGNRQHPCPYCKDSNEYTDWKEKVWKLKK